jgi:hypothetical protein
MTMVSWKLTIINMILRTALGKEMMTVWTNRSKRFDKTSREDKIRRLRSLGRMKRTSREDRMNINFARIMVFDI